MVLEKNLQNGKAGGCAFLDYFSVKYYESNENHYTKMGALNAP